MFINVIFLYDGRMVITFNYRKGMDTNTFGTLNTALAAKIMMSNLKPLPAAYSTNSVGAAR